MSNLRLKADHSGGNLFSLVVGNLLIILFTLGLGTPIALQRSLKFLAKHFSVLGDIETSGIKQSEEQLKSTGEGSEGAFGLDTSLI